MKTKTKRKRYLPGGPVLSKITNYKTPTLAPKLSNDLAPGPELPDANAPDLTGAGKSILDMGTSVLSGISKSAIDNADPRSNPAIAMKKANTMNTASDLMSATAKGAAVGGPWGAAAGLLTAGIGKLLGAKKQKADLVKAQTGWASDNLSSYQDAMGKSSYVKGGTIKGAGTGKSDSINMSAKNGSFIVPSENADLGRQLGEEYLGWKPGEKAAKKQGSVDIKASNSEVIYTPEEVRVLKYHGVDLNSLAPKADQSEGKASGGGIHIKPENKGKFNATKTKTGKSTAELTHSSNPVTKKRAVFAQNAKKWHHADGGPVDTSMLKTGLNQTNNKLAPGYLAETAVTTNYSSKVNNNYEWPVTNINAVDHAIEKGYIQPDQRDYYIKAHPTELQSMLPANSDITFVNPVPGGKNNPKTANPYGVGWGIKGTRPAKNSNMKASGGTIFKTPKIVQQDSTKNVDNTGTPFSLKDINWLKNNNWDFDKISPDIPAEDRAAALTNLNHGIYGGTPSGDTINALGRRGDKKGIKVYTDFTIGKDIPQPEGGYIPKEGLTGKLHLKKKATGGPVVNTMKGKASMTGALVNYMNKPKDTGPSMTTADPNNVAVTQKQRNAENMDKITNDPKNQKMMMAAGSMAGSISSSGAGLFNKMQAIEEMVNLPKNARLGKEAQDIIREQLKTDHGQFNTGLTDTKLNSLGKYWTYGNVAKSSGYKKGGKIMKKKKMMAKKEMPKLSTGMKGKKKIPTAGDMEVPGMKNGGKISKYVKGNIVRATPITEAVTSNLTTPKLNKADIQRKPGSTLKQIKPKSPTNPLNIGFGEVAGAIQAAGGAFGLATAKRAPDIGVSETLKNLSSDVRKQAAYGLDPSQLNVLNNSVERSRRDTNRFITEAGGSGQEIMSKLNTTLGTTIEGKGNIAFQDAAEKARKMSNVINVDSQIGQQEYDVKKMRREDWYKNQEMFAGLLSTGIENVIGARQFKAQQQMMSERDNRPVFSLKTS